MLRLKMLWKLSYRRMPIREAIELLQYNKDNATHAVVAIARYEPIPPKPKPVKQFVSGGVPGRIHLHDAQPGKVRHIGAEPS